MTQPLHLDTEAWTDFITKINAYTDEGKGKLDILTLYVDDLTSGEWKAPAALEFKADFDNWSSIEYSYYEQFNELAQRVTREIAQWLETANTLE